MQSDPDKSLGSYVYMYVIRFNNTSNTCFSCVGDIYKCFLEHSFGSKLLARQLLSLSQRWR